MPLKEFWVPMRLIGTQLVKECHDFEREYCNNLRDNIAQNGQLSPVQLQIFQVGAVDGKVYWLHDGAHRFFSIRELCWPEIRANIIKLKPGGGYLDVATPIKISESIYANYPGFEEREDEPWRAISYE